MSQPTRRPTLKWILLLALALLLSSGCASLKLTLKNAAAQKPSNVALYFSVEKGQGEPVAGLAAETFKIYEDGQLISPFESKQTILNPEVMVVHYTLLLLDLSGSITESGALPSLIGSASAFADRVTKYHRIAVYGFDGGKKLIPLVGFTNQASAVSAGLNTLANRKMHDPSTNLNGAVVEAVDVLQKQMSKSDQPLKFSTLVIFTDGTDRAHRVTDEEMYKALDEAQHDVFVIGLGGEIQENQLSRLGRAGFVHADGQSNVSQAFDQVAARIEASARKFYLLSYCSPSRAGTHILRVQVDHEGQRGELSHEFKAEGFDMGCDPNTKPTFPIGKITVP
jgi:hypothetical protein